MKTSQVGIDLIASFESLRLLAYPDPATGGDPWTIGYGHTAGVRRGQVITKDQALDFLRSDLVAAEDVVMYMLHDVIVTQHQFDALVSLAFNIGAGAYQKSTVAKRVRAGMFQSVPAAIMLYTHAAGKEMPGLVRRRRAECDLWRSLPDPDVAASPPVPNGSVETVPSKPLLTSGTIQGGSAALIAGLTVVSQAATQLKAAADPLLSGGPIVIGIAAVIIILGSALVLYSRWEDRELHPK